MTDSQVTLRKVVTEPVAGAIILPPWPMATESGLHPNISRTSVRRMLCRAGRRSQIGARSSLRYVRSASNDNPCRLVEAAKAEKGNDSSVVALFFEVTGSCGPRCRFTANYLR